VIKQVLLKQFSKFALIFSIVFTSTLHPFIHTNKTFMALPTPHYYLPMKYSCWHRILKQGSSAEKAMGATFQLVPFAHISNSGCGLGKYFGGNDKSKITINNTNPNLDVRTDFIIHRPYPAYQTPSNLAGTLKLSPKSTSYGLYFSYNQELNNIHKGLYTQINLPLQHVENDLHFSVTDETKDPVGGVEDYFTGKLRQTAPDCKQEPLAYLKMGGAKNQTGLADIEFILGQKLVDKEQHELNGAIKVILPTGNKACANNLFPVSIGNNRHWAIGAQFNGSLNINKSKTSSFECLFHVDYTYLFKADEKRTLGYRKGTDVYDPNHRDDTSTTWMWNYYLLGGENGKQGVFPLANVLTQDVNVSPGGRLQGYLSFAYHRSDTTIDFGYSFYSQEGEKISVKHWLNNTYAPAHPDYPTTAAFNIIDFGQQGGWALGGPIQDYMLDTKSPATPAAFVSAIHFALSHTISDWENPLVMGCGFSAEWTQDNSIAAGYSLWAKLGISF
jgi:hypothetical protein